MLTGLAVNTAMLTVTSLTTTTTREYSPSGFRMNQHQKRAADGVFNYASAVLNDGLLLFELRDGIHEGNGERVIRCWKLMLLYWRYGGHTKYALEAVHLLGAVHATSTARVAHELTWCRSINKRGGAGNNLSVDLYMEHLNRTLKDYLH